MASVNLTVSAQDKASAVIERMAASGKNASDRLAGAFDRLGIKSAAAIEESRAEIVQAYERIEKSGVATTEEISRAYAAMQNKLAALSDKGAGRIRKTWEGLKRNWLAVTASITAAWFAVMEGFQLAEEAAQGLQQRQAFANLAASAGTSADSLIEDLKRASGQAVATRQLVEKAGTAMLLGIQPAALSKMMEIARASARVTGQSIGKSFDDISLAVGRGSRMILDNLGIIVQVGEANEKYAATLGKTAGELTDAEKKQAFLNATLEAGEEIIRRVGLEGETAMERIQRLKATMADLREIVGRVALAFGGALVGAFELAAASLHVSVGLFVQIPRLLAEIASRLPLVGNAFKGVADELHGISAAAFETAGEGYQKAIESMTSSWDAISGKVDAAAAGVNSLSGAQKAAEDAARKEAETMKEALGAVDRYQKAIGGLGAEVLRISESGFSADLERQAEFLEKNGRLASNLRQPLESYLRTVGQVYGAQVAAQKEIAEVLEAMGADQARRLDQEIAIAEAEKSLAAARLKGWESYFDKLQTMHSATLEKMAKKQEELLEVQQFGEKARQDLEAKFRPEEALSAYDDFFRTMDEIDSSTAEAMGLSGDKKVEALQRLQEKLLELPTSVEAAGETVVSSLEVYDQVVSRLEKIQAAVEATKQAEIDQVGAVASALENEIAVAESALDAFRSRVLELSSRISELSQTILVDLDDQATGKIGEIEGALSRLQDKTITITANYVSTVPSSSGGGLSSSSPSTLSLGEFASGTKRVPRTGLYQLHQGEEVRNPREAGRSSGAARAQVIQIGEGAIQVSLPAAQADQKGARDFAREVLAEIEELAERKRQAAN